MQHGGDLAITQSRLVLKAQYIPNLAHGQPRLRHRLLPRKSPKRSRSLRLSYLSLTGPTCRGTVARHDVEYRPDITWNPGRMTWNLQEWPVEYLLRPRRTPSKIVDFLSPNAPLNRFNILRGLSPNS